MWSTTPWRSMTWRQPVALFVDALGVYPSLLGADRCWDKARDAREYFGPAPVVAHPPCNLRVTMAAANWWRGLGEGKGRLYPAWYYGGSDGGCFEHALFSVRAWGGVLEHPARSWAWKHHGLNEPMARGWRNASNREGELGGQGLAVPLWAQVCQGDLVVPLHPNGARWERLGIALGRAGGDASGRLVRPQEADGV